MNSIDTYAQLVTAGLVPAGKFHRLACARHLRDRAREGAPDFPYRYDSARADLFFRFAEKLKHYKGEWAGQLIHLEPWEQFITGSVIGWVHRDTGLRRFRTAFNQIPRKNGKTLIAAIVLLYLTFFDGEPGAEGYAIATKRDQAKIVFNDAKKLVQSSGLKSRIKVLVGNLHREDTASKLEPLGADHDSTDGLNPTVVIGDEIHAMKDRGLMDVMETGTGARRQPVLYYITTFGDDPVSPWGDMNDYANKLLEQVLVDETYFVFTAHADTAYTQSYQSSFALMQMVLLCSCRKRKSDDRESELRNAIQSASTGVGDAARVATTDGLKTTIQNLQHGNVPMFDRGPQEIESGSSKPSGNGDLETRTGPSSQAVEIISKSFSDYLSNNIDSCETAKADVVESAASKLNGSQSITATNPVRLEDYSASNAIPGLVTLETLRREYDAHSPTCNVRMLGRLVDGNLTVNHPDDDWTLPETARKANPNYGISVSADDLAAKVAKAKGIPSAQATYKQKHLNLLVNASNPCLSVDGWRQGQRALTREAWIAELEHESCYVGIDLASKIDLCCCSFVFPPAVGRPRWSILQYIWTPADTLRDRAHRDRAPYETWAEQGWLIPTPGVQIDHQLIRGVLAENRTRFDIERIGFDPWHADSLISQLITEDGFAADQVLAVPQTFAGMSSACLKMQAEILAAAVDACGDPMTAWAVSNCVDQRDGKDNMMFVKKKSRGRIDPVIAPTIAVALKLREPAKIDTSVMAEWV